MSKLIIVIGLPGSGKTHYLNGLKKNREIFGFYDDYQHRAYGRDYDPRLSRHYGPLLSKLKKGKSMAISDIIYTRQKDLIAVVESVLAVLPETKIELHYFENSPQEGCGKCAQPSKRKNVRKRASFHKGAFAKL